MNKNNRLFVQYKYQMWEARLSLIVFYFILLAVILLSGALAHFAPEKTNINIGGLELASYIFLFVAGCATFSQELDVCIQTGYTRKDLFKIMIPTFVSLAGIMLVANYIVLGIGKLLLGDNRVTTIFDQIERFKNCSLLSEVICQFSILVFASYIGYLIATIYCVLNKIGRTLLLTILIGGTILWSPIIYLTNIKSSESIIRFIFGYSSGNLYITSLTFLVMSAICAVASYYISLKASVKA